MVRAKNYETVSTFLKVMQKKPWPLFFWTRCRLFQMSRRQSLIATLTIHSVCQKKNDTP